MVARTKWVGFSDFDQIYMAGRSWRYGIQPYNPPYNPASPAQNVPVPGFPNVLISAPSLLVYYYLPLCSLLASPLSLLPFAVAYKVWQFGTFTLLLVGIWKFSQIVLPEWPNSLRLFALGITSLSGGVGWNLKQAQPTGAIVACLLFFAWMVSEKKWGWSILLGVIISVKASYFLPVLGVYLFCRRWRELGIALALIVVLNGLALLRTGPAPTIAAYRVALQNYDKPGHMNFPSALDFLTPSLRFAPDSPLARYADPNRVAGTQAGEQIHLPFIVSAWLPRDNQEQTVRWAKTVGNVLSVVFVGLIAMLWKKVGEKNLQEDRAFLGLLFATLMALSLLVVYHQRYDAIALIPLVFAALAAIQRRFPVTSAKWIELLAALVFAYGLRDKLLGIWQNKLVIPHGWLFLAPLCGYLALASFLAAYGMLRAYILQSQPESATG